MFEGKKEPSGPPVVFKLKETNSLITEPWRRKPTDFRDWEKESFTKPREISQILKTFYFFVWPDLSAVQNEGKNASRRCAVFYSPTAMLCWGRPSWCRCDRKSPSVADDCPAQQKLPLHIRKTNPQSECVPTREGNGDERPLSWHALDALFLRCIVFLRRPVQRQSPIVAFQNAVLCKSFQWPSIEPYESHYILKNMVTLINVSYVFSQNLVLLFHLSPSVIYL